MHPRERLANALSGRYIIETELGQGGMAIVYRAHDVKHDRPVAIKVFKPELAQALGPDRFLREIKVTAQLGHPHILPLLDSGEADGLLYYVMPYVEGETLRHRLDREKTLPPEEALRITREVADGLESAHRRGVIHRDVKPENILLEEGHAVVADFGIARAVAESADARLTATGMAVGTPEYMSPEQRFAGRAGPIDARTDIFALGMVLHEMIGDDGPEAVMQVIRRATHDDPAERFGSAAEMVAAFPRMSARSDDVGALARLIRRPAYAIPLALLVVVVAGAIVLPGRSRARAERGRALLGRAAQLADSERYAAAYEAFTGAERLLPGDSTVPQLLPRVADVITVTSEPAGAQVYARAFTSDTAARADSVLLGETPIRERRLARADYRLSITKTGFAPMTTLTADWGTRLQRSGVHTSEPLVIDVRLAPESPAAHNMVFIPGGAYTLTGPAMPLGQTAQLADFYIDKYEVSNQEYQAFVSAGGYREAQLARFTDKSGMAGPRAWTGQQPPAGMERHPVTGVSWREAVAYCAAQGKRLPTLFEWEKAARNGFAAIGEGVMMPWGYLRPGDPASLRANFAGSGTAPVDAYPFGISVWGAYNMAGNVKEWTANPVPGGHGVTGGSWEDPIYLYNRVGALPPEASSAALGFRCARLAAPQPAAGQDQGAFRIPFESRTPVYRPVGPAEFAALRQHYRYDARPLEPALLQTTETADWTRQKLRYIAQEGDTVLAYLYLPKQAKPPYQTMVYLGSSAVFLQARTLPEELEFMLAPNIRAGRAAFALVFKGMAERSFGVGWQWPDPGSVRFRDLMVLHATELRRGLDYLATRNEIDMQRLAYAALSWGAGSRLVLAGVDDRFRAFVLMGGGIDERISVPALPEASSINFAPYIRPPKLLVNGADDEEDPWLTRALPMWTLLRPPKQLVLVPGAGHSVPAEQRVPAINKFLDQWMGPVRH